MATKKNQIITAPLTRRQLLCRRNPEGVVEVQVQVEMEHLLDENTLACLAGLISDNTGFLVDVESVKPISITPEGHLIFTVAGEFSEED